MRRILGDDGTGARRRFVIGWVLVVVAYGALRVLVVTVLLSSYGVRPLVFAAVELSSSVVYGIGSAHVVGALADRRHDTLRRWAPVTVAGFLAPDVYVLVSGRGMPVFGLVAVVGFSTVTATLTVRDVRRRARAAAASAAGAAPPPVPAAVGAEPPA